MHPRARDVSARPRHTCGTLWHERAEYLVARAGETAVRAHKLVEGLEADVQLRRSVKLGKV